mmetsp:Transcript_8897/g.17915  ORF Transcript_8897/g.17915 Transcript_8897/m.17915 type:complete len:773 (-) Transcript_8897:148-2466(-)
MRHRDANDENRRRGRWGMTVFVLSTGYEGAGGGRHISFSKALNHGRSIFLHGILEIDESGERKFVFNVFPRHFVHGLIDVEGSRGHRQLIDPISCRLSRLRFEMRWKRRRDAQLADCFGGPFHVDGHVVVMTNNDALGHGVMVELELLEILDLLSVETDRVFIEKLRIGNGGKSHSVHSRADELAVGAQAQGMTHGQTDLQFNVDFVLADVRRLGVILRRSQVVELLSFQGGDEVDTLLGQSSCFVEECFPDFACHENAPRIRACDSLSLQSFARDTDRYDEHRGKKWGKHSTDHEHGIKPRITPMILEHAKHDRQQHRCLDAQNEQNQLNLRIELEFVPLVRKDVAEQLPFRGERSRLSDDGQIGVLDVLAFAAFQDGGTGRNGRRFMGLGMVGPMRVGRIERNFGDGMDFSRQSALIHENALRLNDTHIEIRRARTQSHDISGNHVGLIHRDDLSLSHDVGGSLHDHQTVQIQIASVLKKSHDESSGEANDGVDDGHVVIPERSPGPNHKILIQVKRLGEFLNNRSHGRRLLQIQNIRSHRPPPPRRLHLGQPPMRVRVVQPRSDGRTRRHVPRSGDVPPPFLAVDVTSHSKVKMLRSGRFVDSNFAKGDLVGRSDRGAAGVVVAVDEGEDRAEGVSQHQEEFDDAFVLVMSVDRLHRRRDGDVGGFAVEAPPQKEGADGVWVFEEETPDEADHPRDFEGHEDLDFVLEDGRSEACDGFLLDVVLDGEEEEEELNDEMNENDEGVEEGADECGFVSRLGPSLVEREGGGR